MSITIKSGAKVLYQWERGVALTASTPCDILRISREDDRVTDDLYPVISGSTGTALIPDRMLTESGYLHISRIDHADGSERVLETVRILVRHAAKPQNTASSTKEIDDMQTIRMQMAALERAAREGKFDGKDGTTPHIGENGNWWLGDDDTGIAATGDDGITPHIGGNGNWYIGDTDTGVKATGDNGITPHIGANGNWFLGEIDTGVNAKGDDGITPHIGENGNWFIGDEDTGVFARNEDVSLYADDMFTSGILEKGAMPLKILEPSGSNVIRYEIESAVVYIKGIRRARGGFTTSTQAVSFERLFANILRLNVEKGTFSWRVAEVTRDGDNLVNIDNGEIYPARSGGYYDLIPYLVHVPAGATSITYDMVEDLRADERYCGYVRDRLAPAKVSELENDAGYVTDDQIENVITTEPQELTDAEKAQARANIGAAAAGEGGSGGGTVAGAPKNVWYGTGAKAGSSSQFINVTTAGGDFVLADGNMVYVKLTSKIGVVSNVSLNVDGTGSIDTNIGAARWCDNEIVGFVYSESKFLKIDAGTATTQKIGKVLLSSSLSSDSLITAATSSAVKNVYTYAKSIEDVLGGKVDQARTEAAEAKTAAEGASQPGHTHNKSDITDFPTSMTPTAHNQAASTITAGTLAGKVQANASAAATVTTAQVRDIYAGTSDLTAGTSSLTSGTLYFVYE